jgi:hypothetical protein
LNNTAADSLYLTHAELSGGGFNLLQGVYFNTPTPLAVNATPSSYGKVADTVFLPTRGFYPNATTLTTPFNVTIACTTPGAAIRYTTDGSEPTATTGTLYTGPISVSATTVIRAMASKLNFDSTNVDTHTYILPDDVLTQSADGSPPPGWPVGPVNGQVLDRRPSAGKSGSGSHSNHLCYG